MRKNSAGRKGYTLIEVIVSAVILMMAANIIVLSASLASRMGSRAQKIREAGEALRNGSEGTPAEFSMKLSDSSDPLTGNGYVYRRTAKFGGKTVTVWSVWADIPGESGPEAEE